MFGTKQESKGLSGSKPTPYATASDFCRIFNNNMDGLYLLSFVLTGDHDMAEKCFVRGLNGSSKGNPVFKEWAESWARRVIIQNAIQMVRPRVSINGASTGKADQAGDVAEIARLLSLPDFERFAFVMTVLEHFSDQEASLLLNCTRGDVTAARTRALEQLGKIAETGTVVSASNGEKVLREDRRIGLHLAFAHLAPSA